MPVTLISGTQIARTWLTVLGIGLSITAVTLTSVPYQSKNPARIVTYKVNGRGDVAASGTLLIGSGAAKTTITNGNITFQGTTSGNTLHIEKMISASGGIISETSISGATLTGFGLGDCSTGKILYNNTTKTFFCGTDATGAGSAPWSNTGSLQTAFDSRFVNTSGDTMTGALKVRANLSGSSLNIDNLLSCTNLQTSSAGALSCNSTTYLTTERPSVNSGGVIQIGDARYLQTEMPSVNSGGVIQIGDARYIQVEKPSVNSGGVLALTSVKYVSKQGDTMTGALLVKANLSGSRLIVSGNANITGALVVVGNITNRSSYSGNTLHIEKEIAASGSIISEGTLSGSVLAGFGLGDCDTATTSKLLWDVATGKFKCGTDTDTNTTYTAGQGLSLNGTVFSVASSFSGTSLKLFGTMTGNIVHTEKQITSSGGIISETYMSGTTLKGFGLGSCSTAATNKLMYNSTTNKFECGTDQTGAGGGMTFGTAEGMFVNQGGDTMTGALDIQDPTGGNINLYVAADESSVDLTGNSNGEIVFGVHDTTGERFKITVPNNQPSANKILSISSGSIVYLDMNTSGVMNIKGSAGQPFIQVSNNFADQAFVWLQGETDGGGVGGDIQFGVGNNDGGAFLEITASPSQNTNILLVASGSIDYLKVNELGRTIIKTLSGNILHVEKDLTSSGTLTIVNNGFLRGTLSGSVLHAEKTLTSSGTITTEGTISGSTIIGRTISGTFLKSGRYSVSPTTIELIASATGTALYVGSGRVLYVIPKTASGFRIYDATAYVVTAGASNASTVFLRNFSKGNCKVFTTPLTIDTATKNSDLSATPYVLNTNCLTVSGGDYLYVDVASISTTAPKGLTVILYIYKP